MELMNRADPFIHENTPKKYWIPPACSILRNTFHLNNQTLVFYEIEGLELLINFTCLLIQTRKQHLGTIFRYALFVWSAAREKWNFVSDNRKWHIRGFKTPIFSGGACPQTPLENELLVPWKSFALSQYFSCYSTLFSCYYNS